MASGTTETCQLHHFLKGFLFMSLISDVCLVSFADVEVCSSNDLKDLRAVALKAVAPGA